MFNFYAEMWKNFCNFDGRTTRKEFWMAILGMILLYLAFAISMSIEGGIVTSFLMNMDLIDFAKALAVAEVEQAYATYCTYFLLIHAIPVIAMVVRRFNDTGKSLWNLLYGLIPFVGYIVVVVFCCFESKKD